MPHLIRITDETHQKILEIQKKINDKKLGKKIRPEEIIAKAISILDQNHLQELKDASLSNADKLEQAFQNHCIEHGNISKDEFIGLILKDKFKL